MNRPAARTPAAPTLTLPRGRGRAWEEAPAQAAGEGARAGAADAR
jgi:hypothetical protein